MPVYTYCCDTCGKRFEIFQWITEKPLEDCEVTCKLTGKYQNCLRQVNELLIKCSGKVKRVWAPGVPTVIFKGGGWS
jgi:putative FmdB family regulatory protein